MSRSTKNAPKELLPEPTDIGNVKVSDGFSDPNYSIAKVDVFGPTAVVYSGLPTSDGLEFHEVLKLERVRMTRRPDGSQDYTGLCKAFAEEIRIPLSDAEISFTWSPAGV